MQRFSENAVSCLIMENKAGPGLLFELPDHHLDLRIQTMSCEHLKSYVLGFDSHITLVQCKFLKVLDNILFSSQL